VCTLAAQCRELDLAQSALLAGLPQAPSQYDPLHHPRAALRRTAEVLSAMVRVGMITHSAAASAETELRRC
jgi:membrane peptidoglycan carboxypeptidase